MKVYTYQAKYEQPIFSEFHCEYCGKNFTVYGKLSSNVKTEKWVTERKEEALAELQLKGENELNKIRSELERMAFDGGKIPQSLSNEGNDIKFESKPICPDCGYHQRITLPEKDSISVMIIKLGCGGLLLLFFGIALTAILQGTATSLAYVFIIGIPIILAALLYFGLVEPNRAFMKKHGLKKRDLPQPIKPDIHYGQIVSAGVITGSYSTSL
jgi:hypothetical protein